MKRFLEILAVPLIVLAQASGGAAATLDEIVALARAGLSDEVIVELVEANDRIYGLKADDIIALRQAGVTERVIVALLRSGRRAVVPGPGAAPDAAPDTSAATAGVAPLVVVIGGDRTEPAPPPPVVVAPMVAWPYPVIAGDRDARGGRPPRHGQAGTPYSGFGRFINDGFRESAPGPAAPAAPVYWGWDGKLRPGSWDPAR